MTLADIKLAFELATTGELDDYLPKDSQGNPDKKHYQQFNADYFAKILNAYRRKQNGVIHKAYKALPEPKKELTPEENGIITTKPSPDVGRYFCNTNIPGGLCWGLLTEC